MAPSFSSFVSFFIFLQSSLTSFLPSFSGLFSAVRVEEEDITLEKKKDEITESFLRGKDKAKKKKGERERMPFLSLDRFSRKKMTLSITFFFLS